MLTPEYLKHVPDRMVALYEALEMDILTDMARKIAKADYWMPATEWQHYILRQMGTTEREILTQLSSLTGKSQKELKQLMREAGVMTVESEVRRARAAVEIASEGLKQILNDGYRATNKAFANLTKTTARGGAQQLIYELDKAYLKIRSGAFSYDTAVTQAIKTLADAGVKVSYGRGRTESLEVAVRRAVMTGTNQTGIRLNTDVAEQLDAPLMETTAHSGARPSHEVWQGKRFGRNGAVRIDGALYEDFVTATGYGTGAGLGGWNCRHSAHAAWPWESPTYSKELLQSYQDKSIEYNGKHYTEYEASQIQRYQERRIRKWKREFAMLDAAGQDTTTAAVKIKHWQASRSDFLRQTGLKVQGTRERVAEYGAAQARKAIAINKRNGIIKLQSQLSYVNNGERLFIPTNTDISKRKVIAGKGSTTPIRVESRLIDEYGGNVGDWRKCVGKVESAKYVFDVHWYELYGKQYGVKIKFRKERKP